MVSLAQSQMKKKKKLLLASSKIIIFNIRVSLGL